MSKYLIFRTDRIGDFIFSRSLVYAIKKKSPKTKIDFVCSSYNSKYIENYGDINKIYILDKYNITLMIKNFININKSNYDKIIILDGKRRSIFFSLFLFAKEKICVVKDFRPKILLRFFFTKYIINTNINSQFQNFTILTNFLGYKMPEKIKYNDNYIIKTNKNFKLPKNFTHLHLDEKWFDGYYYEDFKNIDLDEKNLFFFLRFLIKKFKKNLILTSGKINTSQFQKIEQKFFIETKQGYSIIKNFKSRYNIRVYKNTSFQDIEYISSKCSELICCEGAISHVSNSYNKKTYALINDMITAKFWTLHMKNVSLLKRGSIRNICKQLKSH